MPRGAGYLYRRGETWWGRVKLAGVEHRSTLRTTDRREAARRLKTWRVQLEREALGEQPSITFKGAAARWVKEVLPNAVKPAVMRRYVSSIRQLADTFGDLRIDQVTTGRIAEYVSARSGTVTNATIRRDLTALSRLLAACVSWGWREDNPARAYDRSIIRERRKPIRPPSREAVAAVIAVAPAGMAAILALLDATGMREAEAVQLERRDVDFVVRTITLTATKTDRPRTIPFSTLGGDAGPILDPLRDRVGPMFPSARGRPYEVRSFPAGAARVIAGAKQTWRVHDLRHGYAIRALKGGMSIYAVSRHLGHTSVKTTENYLGYLTTAEARRTMDGTNGGTGHTEAVAGPVAGQPPSRQKA